MVHFQSCSLLPNRVLTCGRLAVISFVVLILLSANAFADTITWVGNTDAKLSTAANWSGGVAPVGEDAWEFGAVGSAGYTLTNDYAYGTNNSGITFTEDAAGSYTISGNWTKQTGDIVNNSSFTQTINLGHELHNSITINAASGDVNILQNNTINLNGNNLTVDGSYNTIIAIQVNHSGSLIKNGTGTLILSRPSDTNTPFTGNVTINSGSIKVSGTGALGKYTGVSRTITVNKDTMLTFASHDVIGSSGTRTPIQIVVNGGTIDNENGSFNTINALTLKNGGKIVDNNGHSKWTSFQLVGAVSVTSDSKLDADKISTISIGTAGNYNGIIPNGANFNVANVTQDDSVDFLISDCLVNGNDTGIAGSLTKSGAGTMTLSGANTYTGTTTVSGGKLNITGSKFNSRLLVNGSATAVIDAGANGVVNMNADGYDSSVMIGNGSNGTLTLNSGTVTIRNASNNTGSVQLGTNGNTSGVLNINGGAMQVDGRILFAANNNNAKGTLNMNGGSLTLGVSGAYSMSGDPSCGVLWFGQGTSTVNLNGGTISIFGVRSSGGGPNSSSTFNFNGGTLKAVADNVSFFNTAGSMKNYIKQGGAKIDTNGYNVTVAAKLEQGSGSTGGLTKLGAGTLTLSGANTYTGVTTISAGTLKITGSTFNSRLIIDNGTAIIDVGSNGVVNINADGYYNSVMIANAQGASAALNGELILNSGTVTIRNSTATNKTASIQLGTNDDHKPSTPVHGTGTLTINGGTLHVDGRILMSANNVDAKGTLNMNGGLLSLGVPGSYTTSGDPACGVLWFGYGESSVNLNGGTISLFGIRFTIDSRYGNTHGTFNFNGGTLQAVANNNVDFFPAAVDMKYYVKQGGATFDTQGFSVTVGAKLEQGTGENDGEGGFTKLGTGTLTLSQAPAYTGATTVSAGTLKLSEGGTLYNLSGGSLDADGQIAVAVTLDATGKNLTLSNSDLSKFIGSISANTIEKTGDETLQIYTGADGLVDAQSMVISSGRMDFKGYMTHNVTVESGAVFSPGNSVGEATVGGDFILNAGAKLLMEQDETGMDTLIANNFIIDENAIVEYVFTSVQPGATYEIFNDPNGLQEPYSNADYWSSFLTPEDDYYWNITIVGNSVFASTDANAVPEPSTWALLVLGAAGLLYLRKRK